MTNKTTSAIDLVERLQHLVLAEKTLGQPLALPGGDLALITEAADTITRLQAALERIVVAHEVEAGVEYAAALANARNVLSSVGGE